LVAPFDVLAVDVQHDAFDGDVARERDGFAVAFYVDFEAEGAGVGEGDEFEGFGPVNEET